MLHHQSPLSFGNKSLIIQYSYQADMAIWLCDMGLGIHNTATQYSKISLPFLR